MNRLEYVAVRAIMRHRGDLSEASVARQRQEVRQMGRQLWAAGYHLEELRQLRGKSVKLLMDVWAGKRPCPVTGQTRVLSPSVQAVRLSTLRKLCRIAGKPSLVPKGNVKAGLPPRVRRPRTNVAWRLSEKDLTAVPDRHVRLALQLQQEFGLRKKESLLLDARRCDEGAVLRVDRGTKGGQPRVVPIRTDVQRALLAEVKEVNATTPRGTLVAESSLKGGFDSYKRNMGVAGLARGHGLRHHYAQQRYAQLVQERVPDGQGWVCPKAGGPARSKAEAVALGLEVNGKPAVLSPADLGRDREARQELAEELGHHRAAVTAIYIG